MLASKVEALETRPPTPSSPCLLTPTIPAAATAVRSLRPLLHAGSVDGLHWRVPTLGRLSLRLVAHRTAAAQRALLAQALASLRPAGLDGQQQISLRSPAFFPPPVHRIHGRGQVSLAQGRHRRRPSQQRSLDVVQEPARPLQLAPLFGLAQREWRRGRRKLDDVPVPSSASTRPRGRRRQQLPRLGQKPSLRWQRERLLQGSSEPEQSLQ